MKRKTRLFLAAVFPIVGGLLGLLYHWFWGCRTSCPITSNPLHTSLYTAVIGFLLSIAFLPEKPDQHS